MGILQLTTVILIAENGQISMRDVYVRLDKDGYVEYSEWRWPNGCQKSWCGLLQPGDSFELHEDNKVYRAVFITKGLKR